MRIILRLLLVFIGLLWGNSYAQEVKYLPLKKSIAKADKNHSTNELLKSALELTSFRHKILSQNIANINTPGYKADEVAAPTKYEDLSDKNRSYKKIKLIRTTSQHLSGNHKFSEKFRSHKLQDPYEIKPNGNNVSLSQQMTKISQNQQEYNAALKGYNATNALISIVLGK